MSRGITRFLVQRRLLASMTVALVLAVAAVAPVGAAAPPANDLAAHPQPLSLNTPVEFDSTYATESGTDPTSCDGSHGAFAGPYYASVWFSYKATARDKFLTLWAPTTQNRADDFLAITFIYAVSGASMQLVDCTAYGNDASWPAKAGTTYLIVEAGLSTAVTDTPDFSDRGGHGTIEIFSTASSRSYVGTDRFQYTDCGFTVETSREFKGTFMLKPGHHGDVTPYLMDNYEWHQISRNPANGKWFREDGQGRYGDVKITNVSGTVYSFLAQETGRPYTLTDMNGNRVFFDRGRLLYSFQVDTMGDDDLSNDVFIDDSWQLLADDGSHPNFHWTGDWCTDIVQPLLGD